MLEPPVARRLWALEPGVAHLNHGSYGAVPLPVQRAQTAAALEVERRPDRFYRAELGPRLAAVRERVAAFLGAPAVLVGNATEALAIILRAVDLRAGERVVTTDHAYEWVRRALAVEAERGGVVVEVVDLDGPALEPLVAAVDDRTRLVVVDQITSPTAWRLPVEHLAAALPEHVALCVDGAHAPGLLPRPAAIAADFWYGNLHKWAYAPRTSAALAAAPGWRERLCPLVVSATGDDGWPAAFDYQGTRDLSPVLALPAALDFPAAHLQATWEEVASVGAGRALAAVTALAAALDVQPPIDAGLPLVALPLPRPRTRDEAVELAARLAQGGLDVGISHHRDRAWLRLSVQAYTTDADLERLLAAAPQLR